MFCNQCGQSNSNDAKFCSGCGARLETSNTQNTIIEQQSVQTQMKQIELWNPNAAANWSLLFSPAFGAYLHMKNWEALGDNDKAKSSKTWFISSIILSILGLGFFVLVAWYFSIGKKQAKYVKEKFGDRYTRKSWGAPLLIGFGISTICILLVMLIPENKNNQTQQNPSQATQSINLSENQQKPQEMDWGNTHQERESAEKQNEKFSSKNSEWLEKIHAIQNKVNNDQIPLIRGIITNKPNNAKYNVFFGMDLESTQTWWKTNNGTVYIHLINNNKFPVYGLVLNAYHGLCDKNNEKGDEFSVESESIIQPFSEVVLSFQAPSQLNNPNDQCLNIINAWWYE